MLRGRAGVQIAIAVAVLLGLLVFYTSIDGSITRKLQVSHRASNVDLFHST